MQSHIIVLSFVITCVMAVYKVPPLERKLRVHVKPKYLEMRYGESVTFLCKVRYPPNVTMPDYAFYRHWHDEIVARVSSRDPGIKISPVPTPKRRTIIHQIKIDPSYFHYLHRGKNRFYCLGILDHRFTQKDDFVINKIGYNWYR